MINNIVLGHGSSQFQGLLITMGVPPSKNKKTSRHRYTGETIRSSAVVKFYEEMEKDNVYWMKEIKAFLEKFRKEEHLLNICVRAYQDNRKFDTHNFNEIMADGLQILLDVDDNYFNIQNIPRCYASKGEEFLYLEVTIIPDPFYGSKKVWKLQEKERNKLKKGGKKSDHKIS